MSGITDSLRSMTRVQAQALNVILQRDTSFSLPIMDGWVGHFASVSQQAPSEHKGLSIIDFNFAGAHLQLVVFSSILYSWLQSWLQEDNIRVAKLPEALLLAVFECAAHEAKEYATQQGAGNLTVSGIRDYTPATEKNEQNSAFFWMQGMLKNQKTATQDLFWLKADSTGLEFMSHFFKQRPFKTASLDMNSLSMNLCLLIGRTTVPSQQLVRLRVRDVVLFDEVWCDDQGRIYLEVCPGFGCRARIKENQVIIESALMPIMTDSYERRSGMSTDNSADDPWGADTERMDMVADVSVTNLNAPESKPTDLVNVPVTITFDIGQKSLSLKEVGSFQPGQVFDLGRPLNRSVFIKVNGHVVGEGELINVEGHLGVSIVHLEKIK